MKTLSDYQGEEAIELWADIMDSVAVVFQDEELKTYARDNYDELAKNHFVGLAKQMIKSHRKEVCDILLRIDDTPINGFNVIVRLVQIFSEAMENPELRAFFGGQGQNETNGSSGSATENTEEKEH